MDKIILTEDGVKNAASYVPIAKKEAFVDYCAMRCMQKVQINLTDAGNSAMPDMWMENTGARSRYLMSALLVMYLGYPPETLGMVPGDQWLLTETEFDKYGKCHLVNQLDRMKGSATVRDKVFDILRDYRDLEKRLNTAIYSNLTIQNDVANRIFMKLAMDTSEEALEEQRKALSELQAQLEELKKTKAQETPEQG